MGLEDDDNLKGMARIFRVRNYFAITLIAIGVLAAYFRLWQILTVMILLGIGGFVLARSRSSRGEFPSS